MDAYAAHLAQVNEVQDVIARDDILNAQGQIVVKRGTRIDSETASRITRFKLMRPLEHSVVIENELNPELLTECFEVFLTSHPSTAYLFKKFHDPAQLRSHCDALCQFPLLRQKVTVLSLLMPSVFEQAMFCAWFGMLLSQHPDSSIQNSRDFFVAAMCHDIGMVHISVEVLNKPGQLTTEEWRQIQAHPIIGFNIVKETPGIKDSIARAILEHHENLDGTGYPRGRVGTMLCAEGQLLNLLDSINAIFNKHFKPFGRCLRETVPIIQMNQHSRFGQSARHLIMLLKELPERQQHSIPEDMAPEAIALIKARNQYISQCVDICEELSRAVGFRHQDAKLSSLQNAIIHITLSIAQSGLVNSAYVRWLDQVQNEKLAHAYREIEEAYLMMQEITYHIDKLKRQMHLLLEEQNNGLAPTLTERLTQLDQQSLPQISSRLAQVWMFKL